MLVEIIQIPAGIDPVVVLQAWVGVKLEAIEREDPCKEHEQGRYRFDGQGAFCALKRHNIHAYLYYQEVRAEKLNQPIFFPVDICREVAEETA